VTRATGAVPGPVAIEVKSGRRGDASELRGDGIDLLPVADFVGLLARGTLFS
jgi:hypothetical protein